MISTTLIKLFFNSILISIKKIRGIFSNLLGGAREVRISPTAQGKSLPQNSYPRTTNLLQLPRLFNSRILNSELRYLVMSGFAIALFSLSFLLPSPAQASLTDDKFDGNIFALYAGNGSLVPPRESLKESFIRNRPVLLTFYVEDSQDCKKFSGIISQLQQYYGKVAAFTPINADSIPVKSSYSKDEPGYYYSGVLPQTVILDKTGKVVFDGKGQVKYEALDDALRQVFDLLPRTESVELKQRAFNEINTELAP
jgi:hypothetical protein